MSDDIVRICYISHGEETDEQTFTRTKIIEVWQKRTKVETVHILLDASFVSSI
jgi:hypothetical protein